MVTIRDDKNCRPCGSGPRIKVTLVVTEGPSDEWPPGSRSDVRVRRPVRVQRPNRLADLASESLNLGVTLVKTIGDAVMLCAAEPPQMVATSPTLADPRRRRGRLPRLARRHSSRQRGAPRQRLLRSRREHRGTRHRVDRCGTGRSWPNPSDTAAHSAEYRRSRWAAGFYATSSNRWRCTP